MDMKKCKWYKNVYDKVMQFDNIYREKRGKKKNNILLKIKEIYIYIFIFFYFYF